MKVTITTISERQRARFIYTNREKLQNNLIYKKIDTLQKARQFVSRFIYKNPDNLRYAICHEILQFAFMYKKYDTLRYMMFKN